MILSKIALYDASMILGDTPIVVQCVLVESDDSIKTLVIAPVPFSEDKILTLKSVNSKSSKAG